jgi:hypothetical protein
MTLINDVLENVSVERIREHIRALQGIRHPLVDPQALERAADYVLAALQPLGYQISTHRFSEGQREYRNVIAASPSAPFNQAHDAPFNKAHDAPFNKAHGGLYPDERVIVIAHYDTVAASPGADDNASGVAVLLELATVLQALRFERTLQLVAVNLEETEQDDGLGPRSLRGSRALAEHARANAWNIAGVVVLESVAYAGESIPQQMPPGLSIELPRSGDFIALVGNEDSIRLVNAFSQAIERHRIPLPCVPLVVPGQGHALPDTRRSDHAPFWDNGYQAIMLTDTANFRNPHYHQPSDTLETLNLPFAANVCRAVAGLAADLAGGVE